MIGRFFTSCRFLYRHRYLAKKLHDFLDAREIMADGRDFQQTMSDILKNKHMEEVLGVISLIWPEKLLDFTEKYKRAFRGNMRPHCNTIIVCLNRLNNGGIERQISLVTPLWIKMGYKVIVATIETPTPNDYTLPEDCVRTVLPNDIGRYYGCLHELVCEYHADTIFHHVLTGPHFLVAALVATDLKLNLLGEYHTSYTYFLDTLSPEWSRVHRRLDLCDRSVTLSRSMCTFYYALGVRNCRYIPNENLPTNQERELNAKTKKIFEMVWVGRPDDSVKGIEDIIPIMYNLRMLSVHLTVVGQTDEETPVVKAVRQAGLEQIISFVGFQKDVSSWLKRADILLSTSRLEGFGMVIYEAISHGLPIAMYELPYLAVQEDPVCFLLAPMGDAIGLAEVIKRYVSDSEKQKSIQQSIARQNEKDSYFSTEKLWNAFFDGCENSDVQDNDLLSVKCASMIKAIVQMYDFASYHRHPLNEMCNGLLGICVHVKRYLLGVVART